MADGDNTQAGGERSGGSPVWVLMLGSLIPGVLGIVGGVIVEQWRRDRDRGAEPPG